MTEDNTAQTYTSTTGSGYSGLSTADLAGAQNRGGATAVAEQDASDESAAQSESASTPLFAQDEATGFRTRWTDIQASFVDEPRQAVEQADGLVAEVMQRLAQTFADERNNLEGQWQQGDNISTEDLRVALQRYRSFFDRLLSV